MEEGITKHERESQLRRSKELPSKKMENRRNVFELAEIFPSIHIDKIIATVNI
jgi:hypothetical protein